VPFPEGTYTAEDQVDKILEFFWWTDADKRSITVMKAVQMWYYGSPAKQVCNVPLGLHCMGTTQLLLGVRLWRDVIGRDVTHTFVQMRDMESADEVYTKMKMMFRNMEQRAEQVNKSGEYTCTVGTFTPKARFKDNRVPEVTRYCIPSSVVKLSFKPSQEEEDVYKEWKTCMTVPEGGSQISVASDNTET
jgi:hypothetical protein